MRVGKPTSHKSLDGRFVTPVKHETMKECTEWLQSYESQPHYVFGNTLHAYSYIAETYPNIVNWDIDQILIITMDIEVQCENGFPNPRDAAEPLLSITIKNHQNKHIMVWGIGEFKNNRDDVGYVKCRDEEHLIQEFLSFWEKNQPDVITGWNTEFFDIPYLYNRIIKLYDDKEVKRLSPWRNVYSKEVYMMGRNHQVIDIQGVSALDYFDLYRKFTYTNQEKYTLDHIAYVELGERKDGNPYDTFSEWYQKDYQSFIEYNITDVELVDRLEDKMKLIELALTMAYDSKTNYMDVLGTTKYWDIIIYNYLRKKNIVVPQRISSSKSEKFEGAYVKDPIVGMHKWVMSFDLNSLYPHLIMQYNISTETLVSQNKVPNMKVDKLLHKEFDTSKLDKNHTMTPNGAIFRTDKKGFLPQLMEDMYNTRTEYKRKMLEAKQEYENTKDKKLLKDISRYNNIQMAKKISLNSAYGAIGNAYFRYYNLLIAEGITTSGQLSIRWIESALNRYLNKTLGTTNEDFVVASDTDSVYITFDRLVNKVFKSQSDVGKITDFLDTIAKEKIEPFIDKSYQDLSEYLNCHSQRMNMKREVIADKAIWTAKKRYILNAWDIEGVRYKEPQLKLMGIEAIKSSTPAPCRKKLKEGIKIIMSGDEKMLNTFIQDFRKEFMELPPEDIAYPRSVNGLDKWSNTANLFNKGAPIHVKGAILYNHLVKQNKLGHKYPFIQEGDKIKFLNLKLPNKYQCTAMTFITKLPKELDIHSLIDYNVQYEKSFVEPLKFITDKMNWLIDKSYGQQGTLEDFF
jgi:DNA polymerase elongation subunit (family B)